MWSGAGAEAAAHLTEAARESLRLLLLRELSDLGAAAIYERFSQARSAAEPPGGAGQVRQGDGTALYDQFVADMKAGGFRRLFEDNPGGTQLHRLNEFVFVVGCGQHDNAGLVFGNLEPLKGSHTVKARHLEIEEKDVGFMLLKHIQYLPTILSLCYNFKIFFQRQKLAEAVPKNRVVVGDYDPNFRTDWNSCAGRGPVNCGIVL